MPFSEPIFLFVFLPAVLLLTQVGPLLTALRVLKDDTRFCNAVLLAASLLFYAWGEGRYVRIMLGSIAFNYVAGLLVGRYRQVPVGRWVLAVAVVGNLGLLVVFKYANLIIETLNGLIPSLGLAPVDWTMTWSHIHLPIGISFFTFQALSYVIDVSRGTTAPQRNPLNLALYISLFPQLIAGPIVRYHDIARQITRRVVSAPLFSDGVRRFTIGLAKKVLIADVVAVTADSIFGAQDGSGGVPLGQLTTGLAWLGVACYTVQIYFDFSGYSDMAIGLGRMFGFRFLENFNYPYVSRSITGFWRRWHMSLSSWFRDYLYIPLGGNRRGTGRTYLNLVIVFVLCGLWHGASWTFLVWGLYHGLFLVVERMGLGRVLARLPRPLQHGYLIVTVMGGWVLFRAETFEQATAFLAAMAGFAAGDGLEHNVPYYLTWPVGVTLLVGAAAATGLLPAALRMLGRARRSLSPVPARILGVASVWTETAGLAALLTACAMHIATSAYSPFIYFRF